MLDGRCRRCREGTYVRGICSECGAGNSKPAKRIRRRKIGGKRGRSSGSVSQHGK